MRIVGTAKQKIAPESRGIAIPYCHRLIRTFVVNPYQRTNMSAADEVSLRRPYLAHRKAWYQGQDANLHQYLQLQLTVDARCHPLGQILVLLRQVAITYLPRYHEATIAGEVSRRPTRPCLETQRDRVAVSPGPEANSDSLRSPCDLGVDAQGSGLERDIHPVLVISIPRDHAPLSCQRQQYLGVRWPAHPQPANNNPEARPLAFLAMLRSSA